jgi:hypothetical protein
MHEEVEGGGGGEVGLRGAGEEGDGFTHADDVEDGGEDDGADGEAEDEAEVAAAGGR